MQIKKTKCTYKIPTAVTQTRQLLSMHRYSQLRNMELFYGGVGGVPNSSKLLLIQ